MSEQNQSPATIAPQARIDAEIELRRIVGKLLQPGNAYDAIGAESIVASLADAIRKAVENESEEIARFIGALARTAPPRLLMTLLASARSEERAHEAMLESWAREAVERDHADLVAQEVRS